MSNKFLNMLDSFPQFQELLRNNLMYIVDAGCAGGIDPLFRSLSEKGYAKSVGFEASPEEYTKLKDVPNTCYVHSALSEIDGMISFYSHKTVGSVYERIDREEQHGETYKKIRVKCNRLDTFCKKEKIPSIDILKIDVEGHEISVLKGLGEKLKKEVLCVKAEFQFHCQEGRNGFGEIHQMMNKSNLHLIGLTYSLGPSVDHMVVTVCGCEHLNLFLLMKVRIRNKGSHYYAWH